MNNTINEFFRFKCNKGLKKFGFDKNQVYTQRLEYEISVIESMGFISYFLIVADVLNWARANKIRVGPGRGSCAGSLVAYVLGITQIDSIKYDLLFERFLNPERIAMPDIDMDFADVGREKVLEYVYNKYGKDHVSSLATYGTLKCRAAIKAVARSLGATYEIGDKLSKLTPEPVDGKPPTLKKCYDAVPELQAWHSNDKTVEGLVLNWADKVEDRINQAGVHASGYVIGDRPLNELIPLQVDKTGGICSQWDMNEVEKAGLVKFDFLGLAALNVEDVCINLIKDRYGIDVDLTAIPQDDELVFKRLQSGDTPGIFQLETSSGMKDLMIKMQPKNILDLGSLVAIFRPGPLSSKGLEKWLRVRSGLDQPEYLVPELEPILSPTDGFLIYQEQCMKMAVDLAGYTLPAADDLRKAIGKKLPVEMAKHESKFKDGMTKKGFHKAISDTLWNDINAFAAYGFNKSHAIAYGLLAYETAYLKTHYPKEYMCAALTCKSGNEDQVIKYIFNCRELGIKVLPPDINKSNSNFTIDTDEAIRFGLAAVKNLGEGIVDQLLAARGNKPFIDLMDFIGRVDTGKINRRKIDSFILSGAFDYTGATRASMLQMTEEFVEFKKNVKSYESKLETYNKKIEAYGARMNQIKLDEISNKKSKLKPLKNPENPVKPQSPVLKDILELSEKEILKNEKELLGFYVSGHPVQKFQSFITADDKLSTIENIKSFGENQNTINLIAVPCSINERTTKSSGKKMANMLLEDCTGSIGATAFPKTWELFSIQLQACEPLLLKCKVSLTETSDDSSQQAELLITNVSSLNHIKLTQDTIDLQIKLESDKIIAVHKLVEQFAGDETKVRLTFISADNTEFKISKLFSIRNRDLFVKQFASIT